MSEVTTFYLQMTARSDLRPRRSSDPGFAIHEVVVPRGLLNRFLYFLVGQEWEWIDRRSWSDQQWQDYACGEGLRTFVAFFERDIAGYYELSRDKTGSVEIAYFGLSSEFIGRGFGAALLTDALERAWAWDAKRVWVHTCTLDHPAALRNYEARGMSVYDQQIQRVVQQVRAGDHDEQG
jgi:GNAT superfamily N-acetyltransferase